jgi:hypothetical protein
MNARAVTLSSVAALCVAMLVLPAGARPGPQADRFNFTGSWSGTWTSQTPGGGQEGDVSLTVDDKGNVTGESFNKSANQTATIKGSINKDGKSSIDFEFPGQTYTAFGTIAKTSKGTVIGTMVQKQGHKLIGTIDFEVKKDRSRFAGSWSGSWTGLTPRSAQEGDVTMIVDDEGNVSGESYNRTMAQRTTIRGTVNNDGKSSIEFTFPGQATYTASGTVTKTSKGTVTGTLTQKQGNNFFGTIEYEVKPGHAN